MISGFRAARSAVLRSEDQARTQHTSESAATTRPNATAQMEYQRRKRQSIASRKPIAASLFVESSFVPLRQDLRFGGRLYDGAPPTIPHKILMRENCAACHTGPGARTEILTSHPERTRCRQCHVPVSTRDFFPRSAGEGGEGSEET